MLDPSVGIVSDLEDFSPYESGFANDAPPMTRGTSSSSAPTQKITPIFKREIEEDDDEDGDEDRSSDERSDGEESYEGED